jgi:hypothetical protein
MSINEDLLKYHYQAGIKLDYFILSADIALLGWTITNTDWLPKSEIYHYLIGLFWIFLIISVVCGVIRQLCSGMAFGLNYQFLNAGELASQIERTSLEGGDFIDQQTGKITPNKEFRKFADKHREKENKGKKLFEKFSNKSKIFADLAIIFLILALFLLAGIKILTL